MSEASPKKRLNARLRKEKADHARDERLRARRIRESRKSKGPGAGEVTTETVSTYSRSLEIGRAQRHLSYIEGLGSPEESHSQALAEATSVLASLKATDMAATALLTDVSGEAALLLWNRARRALHSLAPVVLMRLADKIDDHNAPGSERILVEVAKGIGLLVPGSPVDDEGRGASLTRADLAEVSTADLRRKLLAATTGS